MKFVWRFGPPDRIRLYMCPLDIPRPYVGHTVKIELHNGTFIFYPAERARTLKLRGSLIAANHIAYHAARVEIMAGYRDDIVNDIASAYPAAMSRNDKP